MKPQEEELEGFGEIPLGTYSYLEGNVGSQILAGVCNKLTEDDWLIVDLETNGLKPLLCEILLVSFTINGNHAYVFNPQCVDINPFLCALLRCKIIGHNLKFDYAFIKHHFGIEFDIFWDTMVTHSLSTTGIGKLLGGNDLENLASRYLGLKMDKSIRDDFHLYNFWRGNKHVAYAGLDVLVTWALIPTTRRLLEVTEQVNIWEELERPLIPVLVDLELKGMPFDIEYSLNLRDEYQGKLEDITKQIDEMTIHEEVITKRCSVCHNGKKKKLTCENCNFEGYITTVVNIPINAGSPKQLIEFFQNAGVKIPVKRRSNGTESLSTDDASLKLIDHPLARLMDTHREVSKLLGSYLIPMTTTTDEGGHYNPNTKCIHSTFGHVFTDTGRLNNSDPNLNNLPKQNAFRNMFVAPDGYLFGTLDMSSCELRILAEISGDEVMRDIFRRRSPLVLKLREELAKLGEVITSDELLKEYPILKSLEEQISKFDMHTQVALSMYNLKPDEVDYHTELWKKQRTQAKSVNFLLPYGGSYYKLAETAKIPTNDAKKIYDQYLKKFIGVGKYIDETQLVASSERDHDLTVNMGLDGYMVTYAEDLAGRRRFAIIPPVSDDPDIESKNRGIRSGIKRAMTNMRIQSGNAEILKHSLIELSKEFKKPQYKGLVDIRLPVHDEVVVTAPKYMIKEVVLVQNEIMQKAGEYYLKSVEFEVSISIQKKYEKD